MKRPTRVPASSVVRMKSASNMIAKWYQSASAVAAERAREDAAPCRPRGSARRRCARTACCSPISCASVAICSGVTAKPQLEMVAVAAAGSAPTTPAGLLIAK